MKYSVKHPKTIKEFDSNEKEIKKAIEEVKKRNPQWFDDNILDSIIYGFENNILSMTIFRIKFEDNNTINIKLHRNYWDKTLNRLMDVYIKKEEYEKCAKIKEILES